jgi:branched-chain amino acid transport system permease protein
MSGKRSGLVAVTALLALLPAAGLPPYYLHLLATSFVLATLASAWSVLAWGGQISFGQAAFFGVGAYAAALAAIHGVASWAALALGATAGAAAGALVSAAALRLSGAPLALATFACAEIGRGIATNWERLTGGGAGIVGIPALPGPASALRAVAYYLALLLLAATLSIFAWMTRSRLGLALAAVREDAERASLLGVNPAAWKLCAFALSGGLSGAAGGLYAHMVRVVAPDLVFSSWYSLAPLIMATLGGPRTALGPAAAAVGLYLASELVLQPLLPTLHQVGYALALIAAVLFLPGGLGGLAGRRRSAAP